ncbi:hypothetical protein Tco_0591021 [Tanacetum coccineum]
MDQKLKGYAVKNAESKRRLEVNQRDNCGQQPPFKRQNVARAYTTSTMRKEDMLGLCLTATSGHYRNECPKLKNQNRGNKAGKKIEEARGKAYVLRGGEANPDSNVVTDVSYAVELADERISETNTVLRGCTLGLLDYADSLWDEVLIVQGDSSDQGKNSKLSIISCAKTKKYIRKGCLIFLAQIPKKETEDKSKEKRLEDVPIIWDFPEVFPEDLLRLPPMRQVEFQIDLVPGAAPVARTPYRLAPTELQELST